MSVVAKIVDKQRSLIIIVRFENFNSLVILWSTRDGRVYVRRRGLLTRDPTTDILHDMILDIITLV